MNIQRPSLDLMYDLTKDNYHMIAEWADSLDNKVIGLFGLMTVLISVVTALTASSITWDLRVAPLGIAFIAFISGISFALRSFQTRQFIFGYDPGILVEHYTSLQPDEAKYWIMRHDGHNWKHNARVINDKADALRWAIVSSAVEVTTLIVWLIMR